MTGRRTEALAALLRGLQADRSAYARLRELLEAQFQAALRHQAEPLRRLADEIVALVDELDAHTRRRGLLLRQLLGPQGEPGIGRLLQRLPAPVEQPLAGLWAALEAQVRDCKALNQRNCQLITDQQALMRRVMGVEEGLYAES
ncbi:MAG: flagellar export chaperone FlgN [Roseateles sp.]|uniref:flagellar export chaperone FlgN n=1 Tax=Roseateles sp. TaxID=1971397 RepID=UPI0039E7D06B